MKKKILFALLLAVVLTCIFAISVSAATFVSDYTTDVTKFYDGEKELMPDWVDLDDTSATAVIKKADNTYVRIPLYYIYQEKGTTFYGDIRDESNQGSSGFRYAWISEKLGETVNHANLVSLEIPYGTESISSQFGGATTMYSALKELVVPTTVTSLNDKFFRNNPIIKTIYIRQTKNADGSVQGVTVLPSYFADTEGSGQVSSLEYCILELDYLTGIKSRAFSTSALREFKAEGPFTQMASSFGSCKSLTTVSLKNTSGTILSTGQQCFAGCTALMNVTLDGFSIEKYAFEKINAENTGMVFVAKNVGYIGDGAFSSNTSVVSIDIEGPITSVGANAFGNTTNLETIRIYNTLPTPATCGGYVFKNHTRLESIVLHGISIGVDMFRHMKTTDFTVRATNVGSIGATAFYDAGAVTEIYIEGPLTSIGGTDTTLFRQHGKLTKLTVIHTGDEYLSFPNAELNTSLTDLHIEGKFDLGNLDNANNPLFQNNTALKNVYLGTGVRNIGQMAFYKCYALEKMYLADTITSISDRAIDMDAKDKQTSASFMFVDENGNMDNTMPTSLTYIGGHFLKHCKISNTQLIFPEGFTNHNSTQAYDFEGTIYPSGFRIIYLGKMTYVNLLMLKNQDVVVYLTKNSSSDLKNERVYAYVDGTSISDNNGVYAGVNANGTLYIATGETANNNTPNGIKTEQVKYYFCGSDEIVFLTRRNITKGEGTTAEWYNFVTLPVTYEQLTSAGVSIDKHPLVSAPKYFDSTCTEDGGTKTFCLGCGALVSIEKTEDAKGHDFTDVEIFVYFPFIEGTDIPNYFADRVHSATCNVCNEAVAEAQVGTALFNKGLGYSVPEAGTQDISHTIMVNKKNVTDYEELTGKVVNYGVVAAVGDSLGAPVMVAGDKVVANGAQALVGDMTGTQFTKLVVKISNVPVDTAINCNAYVIINKEDIYYLCGGDVTKTAVSITL